MIFGAGILVCISHISFIIIMIRFPNKKITIIIMIFLETKEWNRVKTNRTNPGVRSFHSAIVVLDSMFIYGGERSNGNHTNELWRYRFGMFFGFVCFF